MRRQETGIDAVFFDLETTGLGTDDKIVEISVLPMKILPDGLVAAGPAFQTLIDPGRPIPPDATKIHGISDEDVRGAPTIGEVAGAVAGHFAGRVPAGYNIDVFDLPFLARELRPHGYILDLCQPTLDVYRLWKRLEPRSLTHAVRRWCGREPGAAHTAEGDAQDTADVFAAMLAARPTEIQAETLHAIIKDGVFLRGRHKGERVDLTKHRGYLRWMVREGNERARQEAERALGEAYA